MVGPPMTTGLRKMASVRWKKCIFGEWLCIEKSLVEVLNWSLDDV